MCRICPVGGESSNDLPFVVVEDTGYYEIHFGEVPGNNWW